MSNKDLRFLKRSELIETIYQLKNNEDELIKENENACVEESITEER